LTHVDTANIIIKPDVARVNIFCSNRDVAAPRPYHHGSLREALIESALALIAEVGPQAFTLREVARRAKVSHNAPYRHFRDKDELLAVLAAEGFDRLTAYMTRDAAAGASALDRFRLSGRGYVEFALDWPQHLHVMFDLPNAAAKYPEHSAAGRAAFETLLGFVVAAQAESGMPAGEPHSLALLAWSVVHGVAKLAVSGRLPFNRAQVLEFTNYAVTSAIRGAHSESTAPPGSLDACSS
jgi:AcrR family transcriptional regulator